MRQHWLSRGNGDRLVIFVLGWAADHSIVRHITPEGYDIAAIYDYRDMEPPEVASHLHDYGEIYLFAWSFGVWAAERLFAGEEFTRAVAYNGTPFPVHERYGIEPRRLGVTIRGLRSGGMEAFDRRAYGNEYDRMQYLLSPRNLEENIEELTLLQQRSSVDYIPSIRWNKAVIGDGDVIFSPANMLRYWGERAEILPLPHYPFADGQLIISEIGYGQTTGKRAL